MIPITSLDILSDVSVLVLWPYNRLPQSSYVWDVWFLEVCVDLGQIAKLSPGTLVGYTELGLSDLLPIFVFWVCSYFFWAQGISGCSISVWRELCWCLPSVLLLLFLFLELPRSFFPVLSAVFPERSYCLDWLCVVSAFVLSTSRRAALSAAKYLLMYCQVPSNLSRGVTSVSWIAQIFQ